MSAPKFHFDVKDIITEGRVKQNDIDKIKSWAIVQRGVPDLSEQQIIVFLLACCNEYEATKSAILAFYSLDGTSDLFNNRSLEQADLQKATNTIRMGVLPRRTSQNCAVMAVGLHDTKYYNLDMGPGIKFGIMTLHSLVFDNPPDGFIVIIDMKGIGIMHLTRLVFRYLRPFFRYVQEALPVRLEQVLVLNTVYFINKVLTIIRPFVNQKLMEKIHFHTPDMDLDAFFNPFIDMQYVPNDYGGAGPSLEELHVANTSKLKSMDQFFVAEEKQRNSVKK